ncbi:hypothetical protein A3K86_19265 [Photobacterium jeanii]|uniref:Uncharacterized protein n=1 Tax=Photobacterium jeanii TaxID=858640 RepID=A0A178K316_9GAMM|nr:hypothetical protein [Photobacterium jeanii]OAN11112.1 hypothetical protein A3K86_19265 [Photobacterium jeanii]PST90627.1 hypothetical protein C9I91_08365 [Photobacterium jeanii]
MKNITAFIEQLDRLQSPIVCWVFSENDCYKEIDGGGIISVSKLKSILDAHLHLVVQPIEHDAFTPHLLLPEVSMAVPVNFINGKVSSMIESEAA